jgi:acetolactate synthase-1/2/3 large subunit
MSEKQRFTSFSEELASELADAGIKDAFLVTGGAIAPLTSAIAEQRRIRMHYMLTEQSAGIAAEAYGYFDNKPALLIVTSGPGVTNALTPVAAAWTNSSPIIVISGQARTVDVDLALRTNSRQIGNQHVRTDLLVGSIVKEFIELKAPSEAKEIVSVLYAESISNRPGPVWLSIPQDIQRGPGSENRLNFQKTTNNNFSRVSLHESILTRLKSSKKPAILIGTGSREGINEIKQFARNFKVPILTTWPGMDLIEENDELYCGRPGSIPSTWAPNFINVETDFLIVFGARLDLGQVGYNPSGFAPNAAVVRVDVDEEEFIRIPGRDNWSNFCVSMQEAKSVINDLSQLNLNLNFSQWWEIISDWKKYYPKPKDIPQEFSDGISSYDLIAQVSRSFKGKNIVTGSSGTCMEMLLQSWEIQAGQRIINSCGTGSMGFAIPAAIGVSIKTDNGEVVCIESDGSFAMNLQDLVTMKSLGSLFKVIVMDSSGYKSISLSQGRLNQFAHGNSHESELNLPNIEEIARTIGFESRCVSGVEELSDAIDWMRSQSKSAVLVVKVSEKEDALPRLISRPNSAGIMETPPMNELSPIIQPSSGKQQ